MLWLNYKHAQCWNCHGAVVHEYITQVQGRVLRGETIVFCSVPRGGQSCSVPPLDVLPMLPISKQCTPVTTNHGMTFTGFQSHSWYKHDQRLIAENIHWASVGARVQTLWPPLTNVAIRILVASDRWKCGTGPFGVGLTWSCECHPKYSLHDPGWPTVNWCVTVRHGKDSRSLFREKQVAPYPVCSGSTYFSSNDFDSTRCDMIYSCVCTFVCVTLIQPTTQTQATDNNFVFSYSR